MPQIVGGFTPVCPATVRESVGVAFTMVVVAHALPQHPNKELAAVVSVGMMFIAKVLNSRRSWHMSSELLSTVKSHDPVVL